ncbi:MAG: phosphoribosyl-ATP diphosphatase [Gammaproteobacteria bacterium]|nr:phosphoribosyl-ATP diphosphatase [Gammaproteobacteria bacterium]
MSREQESLAVLVRLQRRIENRLGGDPNQSYVAALYRGGLDRILQKLGEEAVEVLIAGKNADDDALVREMADLWFHSLLLLSARGLEVQAVAAELAQREGRSGLAEKAARDLTGRK